MDKGLVVVDGPSGAGKSALLRWASERYEDVVAIPKLTTRPARGREIGGGWSDLVHVSDREFDTRAPDYVYARNGWRYGFSRTHVLERLRTARIGLLVVRHAQTVRRMPGDLPELRIVPVFVDATPAIRLGRLQAAGLTREEAERLLAGDTDADSGDLHDRRIVNDGGREAFEHEVAALIEELRGGV